jgi:hypothetical protein
VNPGLAAGEPQWVPSLNATAWQLPLTGVSTGAGGLELNGTAYLNHMLDAIAMRRDVADPLLARVPGARNTSYYAGRSGPEEQDPAFVVEFYAVPCNTTAEITLSFGGVDVTLPPKYWVASASASAEQEGLEPGECVSLILPSKAGEAYDPEDTALVGLGWAFTSSIYTVFKFGEQPQVGFAPLTDAAKGVVPQHIEGSITPTVSIPGHSSVAPSATGSGPSSGAGAAGVSMFSVLAGLAAYLL